MGKRKKGQGNTMAKAKKGQGNTMAKAKKGQNDKQWLSLHRQLMTE
jgi:hypothetical protein